MNPITYIYAYIVRTAQTLPHILNGRILVAIYKNKLWQCLNH